VNKSNTQINQNSIFISVEATSFHVFLPNKGAFFILKGLKTSGFAVIFFLGVIFRERKIT